MKETRDICSDEIAGRMRKGIYGRGDNKAKGVTGEGVVKKPVRSRTTECCGAEWKPVTTLARRHGVYTEDWIGSRKDKDWTSQYRDNQNEEGKPMF